MSEKSQKSPKLNFPKSERLKSKKLIKELFEKGSSFTLYPLKVFYLKGSPDRTVSAPQVLFVVPKRNFKKAVERNRIKRQIKEAYRLNKLKFISAFSNKTLPVAVGFMYVAREKMPFQLIENKLTLSFNRFD